MKLGIVGHAQDKFVPQTEMLARAVIHAEVLGRKPTHIVSGHSPMGGVDWYAEDEARELDLPMIVHAPKIHNWSAPGGFRDRNLMIARDSDVVLVVVVAAYPPSYKGMCFVDCYHCQGRNPKHVKSGGCWTAWKAKDRFWRIIGAESH